MDGIKLPWPWRFKKALWNFFYYTLLRRPRVWKNWTINYKTPDRAKLRDAMASAVAHDDIQRINDALPGTCVKVHYHPDILARIMDTEEARY